MGSACRWCLARSVWTSLRCTGITIEVEHLLNSHMVSDIDIMEFNVFQVFAVSGGAGVDFEVKKQIR